MPRSNADTRVLLSWSSGKDSAWTLHVLRNMPELEVVGVLTTFDETTDRVAMHGVRRELAQAQSEAIGLPMISVDLPSPCPNEAYEEAIARALDEAEKALGITAVAFGDLFLEDIRAYRESKIASRRLRILFPLWRHATDALAREMTDAGLKAYLTCVDSRQLGREHAGRLYDRSFLESLPAGVDPCGERGEFHTFAFDGPMFAAPIDVTVGEVVEREGFVFADLLPRQPE